MSGGAHRGRTLPQIRRLGRARKYAFYVTSLKPKAEHFNPAIRWSWSINKLH